MPEPEKPKIVETMTSEELGLELGRQYQQLILIQQNVRALTIEIEARQQRLFAPEKGITDDKGKT